MIPVIPLVSVIVTSVGGYVLWWYHQLTKPEQEKADRLAAQYAWDLYQTGIDQLTANQLHRIQELVKKNLGT